jgi:hypothetical protein
MVSGDMATLIKLLLPCLLTVACLSTPRPAAARPLDAAQRVKILMRVLTYDRNLDRTAVGGRIFIGVLFDQARDTSVKERDEVMAALEAVKNIKVKGNTLVFGAIPYTDAASLKKFAGDKNAGAFFVCGGLGKAVGEIGKVAADARISTLTGNESLVREGLAVGVIDKAGKGEIIVNLPVAKALGMALESSLLRLAEVIR